MLSAGASEHSHTAKSYKSSSAEPSANSRTTGSDCKQISNSRLQGLNNLNTYATDATAKSSGCDESVGIDKSVRTTKLVEVNATTNTAKILALTRAVAVNASINNRKTPKSSGPINKNMSQNVAAGDATSSSEEGELSDYGEDNVEVGDALRNSGATNEVSESAHIYTHTHTDLSNTRADARDSDASAYRSRGSRSLWNIAADEDKVDEYEELLRNHGRSAALAEQRDDFHSTHNNRRQHSTSQQNQNRRDFFDSIGSLNGPGNHRLSRASSHVVSRSQSIAETSVVAGSGPWGVGAGVNISGINTNNRNQLGFGFFDPYETVTTTHTPDSATTTYGVGTSLSANGAGPDVLGGHPLAMRAPEGFEGIPVVSAGQKKREAQRKRASTVRSTNSFGLERDRENVLDVGDGQYGSYASLHSHQRLQGLAQNAAKSGPRDRDRASRISRDSDTGLYRSRDGYAHTHTRVRSASTQRRDSSPTRSNRRSRLHSDSEKRSGVAEDTVFQNKAFVPKDHVFFGMELFKDNDHLETLTKKHKSSPVMFGSGIKCDAASAIVEGTLSCEMPYSASTLDLKSIASENGLVVEDLITGQLMPNLPSPPVEGKEPVKPAEPQSESTNSDTQPVVQSTAANGEVKVHQDDIIQSEDMEMSSEDERSPPVAIEIYPAAPRPTIPSTAEPNHTSTSVASPAVDSVKKPISASSVDLDKLRAKAMETIVKRKKAQQQMIGLDINALRAQLLAKKAKKPTTDKDAPANQNASESSVSNQNPSVPAAANQSSLSRSVSPVPPSAKTPCVNHAAAFLNRLKAQHPTAALPPATTTASTVNNNANAIASQSQTQSQTRTQRGVSAPLVGSRTPIPDATQTGSMPHKKGPSTSTGSTLRPVKRAVFPPEPLFLRQPTVLYPDDTDTDSSSDEAVAATNRNVASVPLTHAERLANLKAELARRTLANKSKAKKARVSLLSARHSASCTRGSTPIPAGRTSPVTVTPVLVPSNSAKSTGDPSKELSSGGSPLASVPGAHKRALLLGGAGSSVEASTPDPSSEHRDKRIRLDTSPAPPSISEPANAVATTTAVAVQGSTSAPSTTSNGLPLDVPVPVSTTVQNTTHEVIMQQRETVREHEALVNASRVVIETVHAKQKTASTIRDTVLSTCQLQRKRVAELKAALAETESALAENETKLRQAKEVIVDSARKHELETLECKKRTGALYMSRVKLLDSLVNSRRATLALKSGASSTVYDDTATDAEIAALRVQATKDLESLDAKRVVSSPLAITAAASDSGSSVAMATAPRPSPGAGAGQQSQKHSGEPDKVQMESTGTNVRERGAVDQGTLTVPRRTWVLPFRAALGASNAWIIDTIKLQGQAQRDYNKPVSKRSTGSKPHGKMGTDTPKVIIPASKVRNGIVGRQPGATAKPGRPVNDLNNRFTLLANQVESNEVPDSQPDQWGADTSGMYESPLRMFKSYRFVPFYRTKANLSIASNTYSHKIDPMKMFCMKELEGKVCRSSTCRAQHVKDYTLSEADLLQDIASYAGDELDGQDQIAERVGKLRSKYPTLGDKELQLMLVSEVNNSKENAARGGPKYVAAAPRKWTPTSTQHALAPPKRLDPREVSIDALEARIEDAKATMKIGHTLKGNARRDNTDDKEIVRYWDSANSGVKRDFEAILKKHPRDTSLWIEFAKDAANTALNDTVSMATVEQREKQSARISLHVLSRGLELNRDSESLWIEYLTLYEEHVDEEDDIAEVYADAVRLVPWSFKLWWHLIHFDSSYSEMYKTVCRAYEAIQGCLDEKLETRASSTAAKNRGSNIKRNSESKSGSIATTRTPLTTEQRRQDPNLVIASTRSKSQNIRALAEQARAKKIHAQTRKAGLEAQLRTRERGPIDENPDTADAMKVDDHEYMCSTDGEDGSTSDDDSDVNSAAQGALEGVFAQNGEGSEEGESSGTDMDLDPETEQTTSPSPDTDTEQGSDGYAGGSGHHAAVNVEELEDSLLRFAVYAVHLHLLTGRRATAIDLCESMLTPGSERAYPHVKTGTEARVRTHTQTTSPAQATRIVPKQGSVVFAGITDRLGPGNIARLWLTYLHVRMFHTVPVALYMDSQDAPVPDLLGESVLEWSRLPVNVLRQAYSSLIGHYRSAMAVLHGRRDHGEVGEIAAERFGTLLCLSAVWLIVHLADPSTRASEIATDTDSSGAVGGVAATPVSHQVLFKDGLEMLNRMFTTVAERTQTVHASEDRVRGVMVYIRLCMACQETSGLLDYVIGVACGRTGLAELPVRGAVPNCPSTSQAQEAQTSDLVGAGDSKSGTDSAEVTLSIADVPRVLYAYVRWSLACGDAEKASTLLTVCARVHYSHDRDILVSQTITTDTVGKCMDVATLYRTLLGLPVAYDTKLPTLVPNCAASSSVSVRRQDAALWQCYCLYLQLATGAESNGAFNEEAYVEQDGVEVAYDLALVTLQSGSPARQVYIDYVEYLCDTQKRREVPDLECTELTVYQSKIQDVLNRCRVRNPSPAITPFATSIAASYGYAIGLGREKDYRFSGKVLDYFFNCLPENRWSLVFESTLRLEPDNPSISLKAVYYQYSIGAVQKAHNILGRLVRACPQFFVAWRMAAALEINEKKIEEARWLYSAGVGSLPLCAALWQDWLDFENLDFVAISHGSNHQAAITDVMRAAIARGVIIGSTRIDTDTTTKSSTNTQEYEDQYNEAPRIDADKATAPTDTSAESVSGD
ncbi:hypothetical protein SARC_03247 [Sphaeroforma arctica JP610]|uniref:Uncharacterized protein n=1 Tax=Sphaeroforma arctica JP610 TaxID=667725 RepID=A0A0L0G686_9EUKA|nr:hypothetical protein SARC_03247 [Sphaeroforma arctica JP610]XP_014158447.1 hypothetical protein, variant [Sphaeroforma arctica JP610]KNC84544.1 hypothetical protein, variant [Sphaeroforma arctica JP610]KNC84545.1 hypothetical protein SARC_03247 [Sphaeroforma arctica JP610]|eukprot:XP_014158446.1 hypothetical protein SARC_03247 [Sphaeroforma arctica JP610]